MNPQNQLSQINMSYRVKYIAIGIITYVVVIYAWKLYKDNKSE